MLFYFRSPIFNGLSYAGHTIFRPVLVFGNSIGGRLEGVRSFFAFKNSLYWENQNLKSEMDAESALRSNYDSLAAENISLKEILGRKDANTNLVLSAILGKPSQSSYNTLIIDAGTKEGLQAGDTVFALGNIPVGRVADIYPNSSKVLLFSSPGEQTAVIVGDNNAFMEAVGRGGGNFELILPRDFILSKGDEVTLPGFAPYVLGIVETIISDPRDPFIKALLVSPANIHELKFVQVETKQ